MKEVTRYLAEEIATDFQDGFVSRREALRHLALIGLEASAATTLLTACSSPSASSGRSSTPSTPSSATRTAISATSSAPKVLDWFGKYLA